MGRVGIRFLRTHAIVAGVVAATMTVFATHLQAAPAPFAMDEDAAVALARKSDCLRCHNVSRRKDAPSYKDIAAKYKGKPYGEQKITRHITVASNIKVDGDDEPHALIKSKDPAAIRNVVHWIMTR